MKLRILLAAMCLFPFASTAQVVPVAELKRHAVEPLLRVYGDIEFGGFRYIPTNAGLYVYDANGAPVIHHAFSDSLPFNDLWAYAKRESDLLFFSGGWDDSCYPRTGYATNRISVYRTEGARLSELASFLSWGYPRVNVDPFNQVWIYVPPIMPQPFGKVYVMQEDGFPDAPLFTQVDVMWIHQTTGQVVIRHFMTEGPFAGIPFVTHDGEDFVPYTGTVQELTILPDGGTHNSLIPELQQDFGWRPELGSVLDLQEAPDGSVWSLDTRLGLICLTKANPDVGITSINEFSRWVMDSRLRRQTADATETHASWLQDTFGDQNAWINGFSLSASGDPVLSINRSFDGAQTLPQAWWYSEVRNRLIYWEDPPSSFTPVYDVIAIGDLAIFASGVKVVVIHQGQQHSLDLLPEWGRMVEHARLQRIGMDRVRLYSQTPFPNSRVFSIDLVISQTGIALFENVREVGWADVAWMDVDANGTVWTGTSNGVRGTHPVNAPIEVEFPWMWSGVTDVMVRSNGEIWVASCEGVAVIDPTGELLMRLDRRNGLSTHCALSVSEGASGNVYIGSAYGYTILGDPDLISGAPLAELTPTSIPKEEPNVEMGIVLHPNYPNPFNPETVIGFRVSGAHMGTPVRLAVHDILGREIAVLVDGVMPAGEHRVSFDAGRLASGVYVMRLQAGDQVLTRKMVLVK